MKERPRIGVLSSSATLQDVARGLAVALLFTLLPACGGGGPPMLPTAELLGTMPAGLAGLAAGGSVVVVRGAALSGVTAATPSRLIIAIYEGQPGSPWQPSREVALAEPSSLPSGAGEVEHSVAVAGDAARLLVLRAVTLRPPPTGAVRTGVATGAPAATAVPVAGTWATAMPGGGSGAEPKPSGAEVAPLPAEMVLADLYDLGSGSRIGGFRVSGHLIAWRATSDLTTAVVVLDRAVQAWSLPAGTLVSETAAELRREVVLPDGSRRVREGGAAITPTGTHVVVTPPPVTGPADARIIRVGVGEAPDAERYLGEPPVAISADGVFLATRVGDDVHIYDVTAGKLLYTLMWAGMQEPVGLSFLPGGRELLIERKEVAAAAYDWRSGKEVAVFSPELESLRVSPEGDRLLAKAPGGLRFYRIR